VDEFALYVTWQEQGICADAVQVTLAPGRPLKFQRPIPDDA